MSNPLDEERELSDEKELNNLIYKIFFCNEDGKKLLKFWEFWTLKKFTVNYHVQNPELQAAFAEGKRDFVRAIRQKAAKAVEPDMPSEVKRSRK